MGSADIVAVDGGILVGVLGTGVVRVIGAAGMVALAPESGVLVYVGKNGNEVRIAWVV